MITAYTIISRDVQLLEWCLTNARDRAGMEHTWKIICWRNPWEIELNDRVIEWCKNQGISYYVYEAMARDNFRNRTAWFLYNLYKCWNLGYELAETNLVTRLGSDQFFSQGWLRFLYKSMEKHGEKAVYHTWTIESPEAKRSRHEIRNWGSTWDTFDTMQFDYYANDLVHRYQSQLCIQAGEAGLYFNHPTRGNKPRPDGVTWLQTKVLWEEFGPMSDQINEEGVTGDVSYMDRMYDNGIVGWLCPTSISFHLVRGESRDVQ